MDDNKVGEIEVVVWMGLRDKEPFEVGALHVPVYAHSSDAQVDLEARVEHAMYVASKEIDRAL